MLHQNVSFAPKSAHQFRILSSAPSASSAVSAIAFKGQIAKAWHGRYGRCGRYGRKHPYPIRADLLEARMMPGQRTPSATNKGRP